VFRNNALAATLAAVPSVSPSRDLSPSQAKAIVDGLISGLGAYVDPAVARQVQDSILARRNDNLRA
jgi:hypothetical protein